MSEAIKWTSGKVPCYEPMLKSGNFDFYLSFSFRGLSFKVGDFVVINDPKRKSFDEICRIRCLYESVTSGTPYCAYVRRYSFAGKYADELKAKGVYFDEENEVIEDQQRPDVLINLKHIKDKCRIIYGAVNDSAYNEIDIKQLSRKKYFFCRFTLTKNDKIESILSILSETTNLSPPKVTPISDIKFKISNLNNIEMGGLDENYRSPALRNVVKRNLNKSFESPREVLNYSIVSSPEQDLKIKLRVSDKQNESSGSKTPFVALQRLEINDVMSSPPRKGATKPLQTLQNTYEPSPIGKRAASQNISYNIEAIQDGAPFRAVRRSLRPKEKVSYEEFVSPAKSTPMKSRKRSTSTEMQEVDDLVTKMEKTSLKTPSGAARPRRRASYVESYCETLPKKTPSTRSRISMNKNIVNPEEHTQNGIKNEIPKKRRASILENVTRSEVTMTPKSRGRSKTITKEPINEEPKLENQMEIEEKPTRSRQNSEKTEKSPKKRVTKHFYYISCSDSESDNEKLTVSGKRKSKPKAKYSDSEFESPTKAQKTIQAKSPKSSKKSLNFTPKTPKHRNVTTLHNSNTPKSGNRAKLIREGVITPSVQTRDKLLIRTNTPLVKARSQLHVSYVPTALPCRETEYKDVYNFLEGKLLDQCGGCMYISGVPGTGKTATVTSVINNLMELSRKEELPEFNFVTINGMRLTEPRQSYVEILKQLTGKTVPWEQAQTMLEDRFTKAKKKTLPTVMLVDELDILCTKRQDVVYNLLDWPTKANAQLIVVTIANTMDLPERLLMSRVASRLGLTRLTFQAYTHKQLQEIVLNRLAGINTFKSDAVQFVARKVASVSGDARRALDICRRSAEIAESEGAQTLVSMKHVNEALNAMITQPKVTAIKHCSLLEQFILRTIVAEVERTGVEETSFMDIYTMLVSVCAMEGFSMVCRTLAMGAISRLSSCRLLITDHKCHDITQRIILNVSTDDVYFAMRNQDTDDE